MTGVFTHLPNEYLIFQLLLFLSEDNSSDLWFYIKLRKNSIKVNPKWFLSIIVAYRYTSAF